VDKIGYSLFGLPWNAQKKVAVLGIAYDSTSELAKGAINFPASVRLASYGTEWDEEFDASDLGDILPSVSPEKMVEETKEFLDGLWGKGFRKFFVMGGNHSVTIPVVEFLAEKGLRNYVQFDAHADFRQEWSGTKFSFACTLKRAGEVAKCSLIGVRSVAEEEKDVFDKVEVLTGKDFDLAKAKKIVGKADYVSIDMDVFDIPFVTNPEPVYALRLEQVLESLNGKKMGIDIVEGVPQKLFGDYVGAMGAGIARKALSLLRD
jgi:agmatinase